MLELITPGIPAFDLVNVVLRHSFVIAYMANVKVYIRREGKDPASFY